MERLLNVCDRARVKHSGQVVLVVDYSDSHGLVYGVVTPNFDGHRGRSPHNILQVQWIEPEDLEKVS